MRKLTLKLDELAVESFETAEAMEERGTVQGAQSTGNEIACTCPTGPSCDDCGSGYSCHPCGGGGGPNTSLQTCATGNQIDCWCHG